MQAISYLAQELLALHEDFSSVTLVNSNIYNSRFVYVVGSAVQYKGSAGLTVTNLQKEVSFIEVVLLHKDIPKNGDV
jgi:hypothetical protein